ncbi:MAG TPA: radical SAM protein [Thermodesulfobacteriota bacterium]|nr:radical SAM protein [Thermodesulfobacteriota bacterium]
MAIGGLIRGLKMKAGMKDSKVEPYYPPTQSVPIGLPKRVGSLCPECKKIIPAYIVEKDGRVVMEKTCPSHGFVRDVVYSDAELYKKCERWTYEDGEPISNPQVDGAKVCPDDCGVCNLHLGHAILANVDLTNRCNLRCPICFANANVQGYVYEPTYEQVVQMLTMLRNTKPVFPPAVQFSGGEPTIHPRFLDILKAARSMGFSHLQIASNGIRIGKDLDFAKRCKDAGLYTMYLQFDGTDEEVYRKTRGLPGLWELKQKAVENARAAGLRIVLVPTIIKTINDDQVGKILKFTIANSDVISGISYQPVAFTGRISTEERERQRYTLSDLAHDIERQTGLLKAREDWYPLSVTSPFSKLLSAIWKYEVARITSHSDCGIGTYIFVNVKTGSVSPITKVIDIEAFTSELNKLVKQKISHIRALTALSAQHLLKKFFREENAKDGMDSEICLELFQGIVDKEAQRRVELIYNWHMVLVGGMHFQDSYNYNVDRVKRCTIHYAAPNGRMYPFCTYNSGPVFREKIERQFSIPLDEWRKRNRALEEADYFLYRS